MNFDLPDITSALELNNTLSSYVKSEIRDKDARSITSMTSIFRYQPLHVQRTKDNVTISWYFTSWGPSLYVDANPDWSRGVIHKQRVPLFRWLVTLKRKIRCKDTFTLENSPLLGLFWGTHIFNVKSDQFLIDDRKNFSKYKQHNRKVVNIFAHLNFDVQLLEFEDYFRI